MAEKWNISERMIRKYCVDGRIEGTIYKDNAWMLPENAEKPTRRTREAAKLPILVKNYNVSGLKRSITVSTITYRPTSATAPTAWPATV